MSADLETRLAAWVSEHTGTGVAALNLIPGGASRSSYSVDLVDGSRVFLRVDAGQGPLSGTQYTLAREWAFLEPLSQCGFPVPRVLAFSPELDAILMQHVPGHTSYQLTLAPEPQRAMERALVEAIARLHRMSPAELGVPEYAGCETIGSATARAVGAWQAIYDANVSFRDPAVDFALEWLRHNVPDADSPSVLVHGDVGPGNFLFSDSGEIAALIDWELAHIGHPLEDIACILCRALGVPFGAPAQIIADYEQASGRPVNRRSLDYAVILVISEWCVGIHRALSRPNVNLDLGMLYIWGHANRYAMLEKLAGLAGREFPPAPALDATPFELDFIGNYIEDSLQQVVLPGASEGFVQHRVGRLLQLQRIQSSLMRYGVERYQQEDVARAQSLLGQKFTSHAEALAALGARAPAAAREGDVAFLDFLIWRSARERELLRTAMGEMAQRQISY